MLSLIALLRSAYFFHNPNIKALTSTLLINTVVVIGYYIKWKIDEPITFYMHVFWIFPVIKYAESVEIITINNYNTIDIKYLLDNNIYTLSFLCSYYFIQDYVYTKRIKGIDNPV
tara:strand:+ start:1043 stop:1387 length:345 start_codon:yes stop_codon:yes gene_type:complete